MVFYGYLSHPAESPAELHPEHTFVLVSVCLWESMLAPVCGLRLRWGCHLTFISTRYLLTEQSY